MRVLIVDDHEVVRRGVRALLLSQTKYELCGEAVDGQDALEKARELKPDVIVMDVSMPKLNGLDATRLVRTVLPECEVLILSQHESPEMARQALNAGARGYVVKRTVAKDLVAALDKVSRHESFFDPAIWDAESLSGHLDVEEILQRSAAFEQALRESEQLYRSTFELAAVGVAHVKPEGRWVRVNKKLCEIVGYSEAELMQMTFQEITHPEDLAADLAETEKLLNGSLNTFSMEKRYIRKDGTPVWVNLSVSVARDAAGKVKHFISVVEDIQERREVKEVRSRLAAIVESSDDAIVSKDLDGIIQSWNAGAERIFGFTREEAVGRSITIIIPPEMQDEEAQILKRLRKGERIDHFETVRVAKSGKRLDVSLTISPIRNSRGQIIGASKIARDITESKQVQEALRESQSLLALALDSSKTAIFDWDIANRQGRWNPQMAAIHDFQPQAEYITAEEWQSLFHPQDVGRLAAEAQAMWQDKNQDKFSFEFRTVRPGGQTRWILSQGRIARDTSGRALRMIGTHSDITERKLAEERERSMTAAAIAATAKFRAVFEQTPVFAGIVTKDGILFEANKLSLEACGYRAEEVLGKQLWETGWWRNSPESQEKIRAATPLAAQGVPYREMLRYSWADGTERLVDFALYPIVDDKRQVIFLHPTGVDITDLKRAEKNYRDLAETLDAEVRARTKELEDRNADVLRQSEQVQKLSLRLMKIQDEERRHMARDLHDSAGQTLTVLGINLAQLVHDTERIAPKLAKDGEKIQQLVQQLHQEIRTTSYLLHPPLLDETGLLSALSWYVQGLGERSGLAIDLSVAEDVGRLPADMELAIFRLVQESLTNVHRHSGSKTARITIGRDAEAVQVEVRDQGHGIAPGRLEEIQSGRSGLGIRGLRERLRQFGGEVNLESNGSGTCVLAKIPFIKEDRATDSEPLQATAI